MADNKTAEVEKTEDTEFLNALPASVKRRVKALKNLQEQQLKFEREYKEELKALEKKYKALNEPLLAKRSNIVTGEVEPTAEEVGEPGEPAADQIKGIPGFWARVLKNHAILADTITPNDEDSLQSLTDVTVSDLEGEEGFRLTFHFAPNEYFTNTTLTKTYHLVDDGFGEVALDRVEGTTIDWKPNKDLTHRLVKKKKKSGKRGKQPVTVTVKEPCDSFYNIFAPLPGEEEGGDDEEFDDESLNYQLEADFEMASVLKERVIPRATLFFTGEEKYELDDDFDFQGDEGDDIDDDEDDDDDDDEEDEKPKRGGPAPKKGGAGGRPPAGGAKEQDCQKNVQ